ncbi:MAG: PAS domain S-box protein [Flavobacteriales bacterium]|nr:PAS domain S-box protein [Flavobacteriales bacterium]
MNSDALFKNLFETAPVPLIVTDHNGIIIFANQRSSAQLGYDKELLHGKYLYDLIEGGASGNILDHSTTWTFKNFVELQKSNPLFLIKKMMGHCVILNCHMPPVKQSQVYIIRGRFVILLMRNGWRMIFRKG